MKQQYPVNLYETLVRHQFYSKIDWKRCHRIPEKDCERELRAIVGILITGDAAVLSPSEKHELAESILNEVREFGFGAMARYSQHLASERSLWSRLLDWLQETISIGFEKRSL